MEAVSLVQTGISLYEGRKARKEQKAAGQREEQAQREAVSAAARQQRETAEAISRENKKKPDYVGMLATAGANKGLPTLFAGPLGVDNSLLSLGSTSLLGGV